MNIMERVLSSLTDPVRLYMRSEVLGDDYPVPSEPGVYAWYFNDKLPLVPTYGCVRYECTYLLYLRISPGKPSKDGRRSSQNLRKRIKYHYSGNAYGSTLRKTLGCLLSEELGIEYITRGRNRGLAFTSESEERLSGWMGENAFVTWETREEPWLIENRALNKLSLPLNIKGNQDHPFHPKLREIRKKATEKARQLKESR
jgi:hypothetical protein